MGLDPITIGLVAAGTGLNFFQNRAVAKKRNRATVDLINQQRERQQQANAVTQQALDRTKGSSIDPEQSLANAELNAQIAAARDSAGAGFQRAGAVGDRFNEQASDAALGVVGDALNRARSLATLDAGGRQRTNEGIDRQRAANDLGIIGNLAQGENRVGQIRINSIQANPLVGALSQLLQGAAAGRALSGAGTVARPGLTGAPSIADALAAQQSSATNLFGTQQPFNFPFRRNPGPFNPFGGP